MNADELFIPTLNKQGFAAKILDSFSRKFASSVNKNLLEIGAAYGFATLNALEKGHSVTANDLDNRHLSYLQKEAKNKGFDKLTIIPGRFPDQIDFSENSFDKILVSRVLHFMSGDEILESLIKTKKWMKIDGQLIIVCETPYLKNWTGFLHEYEQRKKAGVPFPGEIDNPEEWENNRTENLPAFVHWLDKDILGRVVKRAGLDVVDCAYYTNSGGTISI